MGKGATNVRPWGNAEQIPTENDIEERKLHTRKY